MMGEWKYRASALAILVAAVLTAPDARAAEPPVSIDIPAQGLGSALEALAGQAHVQMLYSADLVRGLTAPGLKGEFTPSTALDKLLKGSGLEARPTGDGSFTLARLPASAVSRMETITVVATRTENRAFDVPASVSTVTRDQIADKQAPDLKAVVNDLPGVTMEGTRLGAEMPTIRGYFGPDIILRVDDARRSLDASVGIYTPMLVDPNFVRQVDVVRGPSSASYGGGGLGGVMSVRTVDADDILAPGQSMGGQVKAGRRTADGSLTTNLLTAAQYDGVSALAGGTFMKYDGDRNGTGQDNVQNGMQRNGLFKLGWAPDDLHKLTLSYMRFSDDGWGPTNPSSAPGASNGYQYQQKHQEDVVANYRFKGGDLFDGKASVFQTELKYDNQKRQNSDPPNANSAASNTTFDVVTRGGNVQNTSRFDVLALGHRLTYGLDGYSDSLTNTSNGGAAVVNPNGNMLARGAFVQDEIQLPYGWSLIPTLRYDSYDASASSYASNSNSHTSPKIAAKWQIVPQLAVFASYGEAFRAPTLSELYMNSTGGFRSFAPNPSLLPENSRAKEVGATLSFDDLAMAKDALRFKINAFDETVNNRIVQKNAGSVANPYQYQNIAQAHRWGGEAEMTYHLGDWNANLGYSRVRVIDVWTGENLYSPPDKLTAGLSWFFDEYLSFRYAGRFYADQHYDSNDFVSTNNRRRDAYSVHDIGMSYDRDWYRVDLGVTNLFDKAYVPYYSSNVQSYSYAEGRSVNMTVTGRF